MKERPILFNGEMVRALLGGRKTQTRRIVKPQPTLPVSHFRCVGHEVETGRGDWQACDKSGNPVHAFPGPPGFVTEIAKCPYGKPGDRLWVRETHHVPGGYFNADLVDEVRIGISTPDSLGVTYRADAPAMTPSDGGWSPSIHMPRWSSRITLEVNAVRVERLQDISRADAEAEGLLKWPHKGDFAWGYEGGWKAGHNSPTGAFSALWKSINGSGSWAANPWVWVVEFKRAE